MAEWLALEENTIYHSPATLFRHFATTLTDSDHFPQLRLIHLANEPVFSSDIALYKKHFHDSCLLVSSYGTTEALTFRFYFIDHHTPVVGNTVPVGYPVEDREVLILSEDGEKLPPARSVKSLSKAATFPQLIGESLLSRKPPLHPKRKKKKNGFTSLETWV